MSKDFFRMEKGLHIVAENTDVGVHYLFGAGVPGSSTDTNNAERGSMYADTNSGYLYRKKAPGTGTDKWVRHADYDDILNLRWRSESVVAITTQAAPADDATIDLAATPLTGDETPFLEGADFVANESYILFGAGGTEKLMLVTDVTGEVITVTSVGFDPLAAKDTFIVENYLLDSPDAQEKQAIVLFNGTDYIKLGDVNWEFATGIKISASYTPAFGNPSSADTVESAIEKIDGNVDAINSLTGIAQGGTNLGAFTGTIISDNNNIKGALQEIETDVDAIQTLTGVAAEATNLGAFTGVYVIPDNQTIKAALQSLETHAERGFFETAATNITTVATIDQVVVDDVSAVEWTVMIELASDPARRRVFKMLVTHDGTPSADATATDETTYAVIKLGTTFNNTVSIDINGTGAAQVMRLRVAATGAVNVRAERRVIKAA